MFTTLTKTEVSHLIDSPAGILELATAYVTDKKPSTWAIVCHPHPLFGGSMYNKVVTTLVKVFHELEVNTVRFNFRGVGKSTGVFAHGDGELEDLLTVIKWLTDTQSPSAIWLAGFSFGAYVAAKAATQLPVAKLITIAPPVIHFPMQSLPPITCPWILAQGEKDEVVSATEVIEWAKNRVPKPIILRFPEASHFFHGQLGELRVGLVEALRS